jgi:hypothetical protein
MSTEDDKIDSSTITNEFLDDRVFKFQVYFWNNDNRIVKIPKGTIKELVLHDNILDWFHSGYMIFRNPKDVFERSSTKYVAGEEIETIPYRFRNDGHDYLYIEIDVPIDGDIMSATSLNNKVFTIRLICSMYHVEDIAGGGPGDKMKKVYFWDYRQQLMTEKNMFWSTAHAVKRQANKESSKSLYLLNDDARSLHTGDAIKDLIIESLKTSKSTPEFEDDFSKGGERLFYTSSVNATADVDFSYLLKAHVHDSKTAEPCILRVDRYTSKWSLLPISEFYKRAYIADGDIPGEYQLDKFLIGNESLPEEVNTNIKRVPEKSTAMNNFFLQENIINEFEFMEMSAMDSVEFMNSTMVHMYDHKTKQFNVQQVQSDIEATRDFMKENIFGNMIGGTGGVQPSIVLNKNRTDNRNIMTQFTKSASKIKETALGRNKTIMTAILNGNTIKFNVKGFTSRQSGRFISIDRGAGYPENDFDDKILGQYLTTSVIHRITGNGYHNEVIAVKPYYFQDQKYNEEYGA